MTKRTRTSIATIDGNVTPLSRKRSQAAPVPDVLSTAPYREELSSLGEKYGIKRRELPETALMLALAALDQVSQRVGKLDKALGEDHRAALRSLYEALGVASQRRKRGQSPRTETAHRDAQVRYRLMVDSFFKKLSQDPAGTMKNFKQIAADIVQEIDRLVPGTQLGQGKNQQVRKEGGESKTAAAVKTLQRALRSTLASSPLAQSAPTQHKPQRADPDVCRDIGPDRGSELSGYRHRNRPFCVQWTV